ncbi:MAG TPA: DinB family protein [Fimbriimonadaceae bacterium]|nr:DinB family protein [Fimbriimonadaceae bacterium]
MTTDDILEAWRANDAQNHALLALCEDGDFDLKPGKGKTIRSNFVHIVGVRKSWSQDKLKKESASIPKLDWKTATREEIVEGLEISNDVMLMLLEQADDSKRRAWTPAMFFAYAVAHEAHHRSQVEIALRINGREPDDLTLYGLWEWPKVLRERDSG